MKTIVTAFISIEVPPDCDVDIGEKVKTRLEWFITNLQRVEIVGKRKNDARKNETQIDYAIGLIYRGRAKQEDLNDQLRYASTGNDSYSCYFVLQVKVGCLFSKIFQSEFSMWKYRDNNHREDPPHLIL